MINKFFVNGGIARELEEKLDLCEKNGFRYNFDRDVFINKSNLTIVSMEYVQDTPLEALKRAFLPNNIPRVFLSDEAIPQKIKDDLIKEFFPG